MEGNRHIIRRASLLVQKRKRSGAQELQHQLASLFWEELAPEMEAVFSELAGPEELIRIERLELDLGNLKEVELEKVLKERLAEALRKELKRLLKAPSSPVKRQPRPAGQFEAWLSFLEKGYWPWAAAQEPQNEALQKAVLGQVAGDSSASRQLQKQLNDAPNFRRRLAWQYEDDFLQQLLIALSGTSYEHLPEVQRVFSRHLPQLAKTEAAAKYFFLSIRPAVRAGQVRTLFWEFALRLIARASQRVGEANLIAAFLARLSPQPEQLLKRLVLQLKESGSGQDTGESLRQLADEWAAVEERSRDKPLPGDVEGLTAELGGPKKPLKGEEKELASGEEPETKGTALEQLETNTKKGQPPGLEEKTAPMDEEIAPPVQKDTTAPQKIKTEAEGSAESLPMKGQKKVPPAPSKAVKAGQPARTPAKEGTFIYLQGAGLILLHPFLSTFLRELKLAEGDDFVSEEARHRAVQLLDLLAFGQKPPQEHEMVLPKILCEMPLEIPVNPEAAFTETELEEAEHLLRVVIQRWKALGTVSPDGLREGFLQREGRLERKANGWHLTVKRKTEDILVDRLPWGRGMIQLPWMKEVLRVEW